MGRSFCHPSQATENSSPLLRPSSLQHSSNALKKQTNCFFNPAFGCLVYVASLLDNEHLSQTNTHYLFPSQNIWKESVHWLPEGVETSSDSSPSPLIINQPLHSLKQSCCVCYKIKWPGTFCPCQKVQLLSRILFPIRRLKCNKYSLTLSWKERCMQRRGERSLPNKGGDIS